MASWVSEYFEPFPVLLRRPLIFCVFRHLGSETVTIIVGGGSNQRTLAIHRTLLTSRSKFFEAAFNGSFKEAGEKRMVLPEDDPSLFDDFVYWLYKDSLPGAPYRRDPVPLFPLYTLADRYDIPALQAEINDVLRFYWRDRYLPSVEHIKGVYSHTNDPKIRQYIVQLFLHKMNKERPRHKAEYWTRFFEAHTEFARDLGMALLDEALQRPRFRLNRPHPYDLPEYDFLELLKDQQQTKKGGAEQVDGQQNRSAKRKRTTETDNNDESDGDSTS